MTSQYLFKKALIHTRSIFLANAFSKFITVGAILIALGLANGQSLPQENLGEMDTRLAGAAADNRASIAAETGASCSGINFSQPAGSPVAAISPLFMVTADLNGD